MVSKEAFVTLNMRGSRRSNRSPDFFSKFQGQEPKLQTSDPCRGPRWQVQVLHERIEIQSKPIYVDLKMDLYMDLDASKDIV